MSKELYTVKEFAAAVGVSDKAIYQQIQGRLKDYVVTIDSVKYIKNEAIERFYSGGGNSRSQVKSSQFSSQVESSLEADNKLLTTLQSTIEALQQQLEAKDKQIEKLSDLLEQSQENLKLEKQAAILERQKVFELEAAAVDDTEQQNQKQDETEPPQKNWWKFWK